MGTGVTEIIRLFAGHFHLADETGRIRETYDNFAAHRASEDFAAEKGRHDTVHPNDLDEFSTSPRHSDPGSPAPGLLDYAPMYADPVHTRAIPPDIHALIEQRIPQDFPHGAGGLAAQFSYTVTTLYQLVPIEPVITVTYDTGGAQYLIQIQQLNVMLDNDIALPEGWSENALMSLQEPDILGTVQELNAQADAEFPPEFAPIHYDTASLIGYAAEYDATWKDTGLTTRSDVEPGVHINGELQPAGTELPVFPVSLSEEETPPPVEYDTHVPAQIVTAGSNLAANVASIVDINHPLGTLVVVGDYFRTDAIVQLNLYVDDDKVSYAGDGAFHVESGGNQAFNIASFLDTDPGIPSFAGSSIFAGLDWHVDVLNGDLYDVTVISQTNWMYDNDIAVQNSYQTHYQLIAGANEQGNFSDVVTIGGDYDLVIVLGDYHEINFIYQKNILYDPDTVKVLGYDQYAGEGALTDPSVSTGGNWLHNEAVIEQWGTNSYQALTPSWEELISRLNAGDTQFDVASGFGLPNFNDPTFNILLVTGDVYDINAIKQENIVADADVVIQTIPAGAGLSDPAMQVASTGSNALGNFASIVHTGPAADYYIGGDVYEDDMLIQTELIASDDDHVHEQNPEALANELVAFTTPVEDDCPDEEIVQPVHDSGQSDVLGHVLV